MNQTSHDEGYTLTIKQVAQRFNTGVQEVRHMISTGAIDAKRIGSAWRIRPGRDSTQARIQSTTLTLWHGTSENFVVSIQEQGFKARSKNKQVWFTDNHAIARKHARGRAESRRSHPVVFTCEISLLQYPHFWNPKPGIYVFAHTIGKEVIKAVDRVEESVTTRAPEEKEPSPSVDVLVTQTSGRHGILYWVNQYLALQDCQPLDADHPAVDAITQWVEMQYTEGKTDPIDADDLLEQVKQYI